MKIKNNSAIALILTVGILAILALVAVGFSAFTRLELRATENFANQFKAELIAEAGIARAINDLKYEAAYGAKVDPYDTMLDPWFYASGVNIDLAEASSPSYGSDISYGGGTYRLKVIDCASLININTPLPDSDAENDFKNMIEAFLDSLGLRGVNSAMISAMAQDMIDLRNTLPDRVYSSKDELKLITNIGESRCDEIKKYITLYNNADDISGHTFKTFVNVNTASANVLYAVLRDLMDDDTECNNLTAAIVARQSTNPFDGKNPDANVFDFICPRSEFGKFLDYAADATGLNIISQANRDSVLNKTDPNLNNTDTTHFSFDSGGYYEIEAIGSYRGTNKRIKKAALIYNKIYETTKNEFLSDGNSARINLKNRCPINFSELKQHIYTYNSECTIIRPNAVKLGFWDDFEDGYPLDGTGKGDWIETEQEIEVNLSGNSLLRSWPIGKVFIKYQDYFPKLALDPGKWLFDGFCLRARLIDETSLSKDALRPDLPWPAVPESSYWQDSAPLDADDNPLINSSNCSDVNDGTYSIDYVEANLKLDALGNPIKHSFELFMNVSHIQFGMGAIYCSTPQNKDFFTSSVDIYQNWVNYDGTGYIYFGPPPDMKDFNIIKVPHVMVYMNDWLWGGHTPVDGTKHFPITKYYADKTIRLKSKGQRDLDATIYATKSDGTPDMLDIDTGREPLKDWQNRAIKVVGMGNFFDLDNVRIIPEQGVYTSNTFDPTGTGTMNTIEWGTISAETFLSENALAANEKIFLTTNFSAGENLSLTPAPGDLHPASAFEVSGGPIGSGTNPLIGYRAYIYSGYGNAASDYQEMPVLEAVTMTYMPLTKIVYQSKI
ncbi:MAG: general secretion pathway protein GspK [Candidatus Omnitrophica bacterium]|nr:general secretion pathway protein GspK [Candidatus Omnitrophota bacterium]